MSQAKESAAAAVIELRGVGMVYPTSRGEVEALQDVDLAVAAGSMTAVVGRSGSGKSTLLAVMGLIRRPSTGAVLVEGVDLAEANDARRARIRATRVGIVFQAFHLEPALTAAENTMLAWFTGAVRLPYPQARARAIEVLDALGIAELAGRRRDEMSGGQRQRVAIARALFARPVVLLADEPTGNLDESTADQVVALLRTLPDAFGTAVVVVTHDRAVATVADERVSLTAGRLSREAVAAS